MTMNTIRKILKSMICGSLAFLVSYVTLGPIMQPATLLSHSSLPNVAALHTDTAGQPS
jgi:hypothetical protein